MTDSTPTLSNIVDQIIVRIESISSGGDTSEIVALTKALNALLDYVDREKRLYRVIDQVISRTDGRESA